MSPEAESHPIDLQSIAINSEEGRLRSEIANNPRDLELRRSLAALMLQGGKFQEAVSALADAIRIDHCDVPTLIALAHAQRMWGNHVEAEQACLLALEQQPGHPEALAALSHVYIARNQVADAIPILETSLELQPNNTETRRLYGVALEIVGRLDDSRRELLRVVTDNPNAMQAYVSLSEIEVFTPDHDLLKRMQSVLSSAPTADDPRLVPLYYALGKAYDDIGDYDRAFGSFQTGARLRRSQIRYDENEALEMFDEVMAVFTSTLVALHPVSAAPSGTTPVFIVGMPRSGSTLLEQILSRHPRAYCSGESHAFGEALAAIRRDKPDLPLFPQFVGNIDAGALARVSSAYRAHMHEHAGLAHIFVNKHLINFMFMGAIHMAMPDARFIIARRNALDTCLSAYVSYFEFDIPFSYDLRELGHFYCKFEQMIAHWGRVLPGHLMRTVHYEELVTDLEGQTRGILDFLNLPWDPECLAFHRSKQPVRTASAAQVRRPLYSSSVGRWRRYESHLKPLVDVLGTSEV